LAERETRDRDVDFLGETGIEPGSRPFPFEAFADAVVPVVDVHAGAPLAFLALDPAPAGAAVHRTLLSTRRRAGELADGAADDPRGKSCKRLEELVLAAEDRRDRVVGEDVHDRLGEQAR